MQDRGAGMSGGDEQQPDELMRRLGEYADDDPSEERDHPLVLRYLLPEDFAAPLTLPKVSLRLEEARAQIAAIALDKARHARADRGAGRRTAAAREAKKTGANPAPRQEQAAD